MIAGTLVALAPSLDGFSVPQMRASFWRRQRLGNPAIDSEGWWVLVPLVLLGISDIHFEAEFHNSLPCCDGSGSSSAQSNLSVRFDEVVSHGCFERLADLAFRAANRSACAFLTSSSDTGSSSFSYGLMSVSTAVWNIEC